MTIHGTLEAASASLASIPDAALVALLEHSTDFIGLAAPDGQILFVNAVGQQLVGLDEPAQVRTTVVLDYVASEGQERFQTEIWPTVLQQGHWEGEIPFRHFKTGTAIPMHHSFFVIKDEESHQPHTLATISRPLTTPQRVETAVRDIAEGISAATGVTFFRSLMQYLAKTLAVEYAFVGEVSPEDNTRIRTVAVCADGQMAPNFEYDLRDTPCQQVTSGTLCVYPDHIQSHFPHDRILAEMGVEGYVGTPLVDSQERVIGLMVVLSRRSLDHPDLCVATLRIFAARAAAELERQQAEEALRASEQRWRTMFENTAMGIALVDMLGHPLQSNPALQRMLDYTADELHRMSFVTFTHPEDAAKDWALVREVFAGQRDHYQIEKRYLRKDGQVLWGNLTVSAIRDVNGSCQFVIGMLEDITERKHAEEQLQATSAQLRALMASLRSAKEQEGVRIAREIHDELGSALTSLKWDLEEIDTTLAARADQSRMPALRGKIETMVERLDATMQVVRRIAADLRPHLLDDLGLEAAIAWHMQQLQARTGLLCQYDGVGHPLDVDQEQSTTIFRIMQEALTNVLRHAHATRVDVTLEEEEAELVLTISDNGRGITDDEQSGPHTLGLLGMRERAHLIEGTVDITGIKGQGTTVTVRVPHASAQRVQRSSPREIPGAHHRHNPARSRGQNYDENPGRG
jgi:PAS domain S-box-containing protein